MFSLNLLLIFHKILSQPAKVTFDYIISYDHVGISKYEDKQGFYNLKYTNNWVYFVFQ